MVFPLGDKNTTFAYDQVVIAQDSYHLEYMLKRLYDEYQKWGLKINLVKTEYLIVHSI